jgi:hypothetical protein
MSVVIVCLALGLYNSTLVTAFTVAGRFAALSFTFVLVVISVGGSTERSARAENDPIREGVAAYDALEYEKAIALLDAVLGTAHAESLTKPEKILVLRTLALAQFALGHEPETRAAFERLLRVDPGQQLDRRLAPRLRVLFEETRAKVATQPVAPRTPDGLLPIEANTLPAIGRDGAPLTLRVPESARAAPMLTLYHRSGGARAFSRVEAHRLDKGGYEVTVPGALVHPPTFEYYLVLLDRGGVPVAGAGSLGDPVRIPVQAQHKPVYKKAWFWGTIVGVAAAGALAAALAVTLKPADPAAVTVQPH